MLRYICAALLLGIFIIEPLSSHGQNLLGKRNDSNEIWGEATNFLQPRILVSAYDASFSIEFFAKTNFSRFEWLKTTNRVGSKLQLWQTNGMEVFSRSSDVLSAMQLPHQTTVSNIMRGVYPTSTRGMQWWRTGFNGSATGESEPSTAFSLRSAFDISPTNDYVLQITPLLYKVETNRETAHLVEFPPIKVKLLQNGSVQQIK